MADYFRNYTWSKGKPQGEGTRSDLGNEPAYRIITDPYHKWYTVEEYADGLFRSSVYDSRLLDFRHLNPQSQVAWQEVPLRDTAEGKVYLIRNGDDRVIILEEFRFRAGRCEECRLLSPQGLYLGRHRMRYRDWGDAFDGVTLEDATGRRVMEKRYSLGPNGEFEKVLVEEW